MNYRQIIFYYYRVIKQERMPVFASENNIPIQTGQIISGLLSIFPREISINYSIGSESDGWVNK